MRKQLGTSIKITMALLLSFFTSGFMPVMTAYATQPPGVGGGGGGNPNPPAEKTCKDASGVTEGSNGWGMKVDTVGNPQTVTVNATSGYVIDKYCVKAGNETDAVQIVTVTPASAQVVIDHPTKDSVSHYIVHEIPAPAVVVPVSAAVYTAPTCTAAGSITGTNTSQYTWVRTGPDSAAVLTATAIGNVTLTGQTVFGPYNLNQLTGTSCQVLSAINPPAQPVPVAATCEAHGSLTLTNGDNYTWSQLSFGPGTHTVTATANGNLTFTDGKKTVSYTITVPSKLTGAECNPDTDKVTLCHATGSQKNPFVKITVSAAGAFNGHLGSSHQDGRDIIPEFTYQGKVYSQNWKQGDQLDCPDVKEVTPVAPNFVAAVCLPNGTVTPGSYSVTATEGVTYSVSVNGTATTSLNGTVSHYPTTVVVTASAANEGYKLTGTASWNFTFTEPDCDAPALSLVSAPCINPSSTGVITVMVTNPNNFAVDFEVDLVRASDETILQTKTVTVAANTTANVAFTGLVAQAYLLDLYASHGNGVNYINTVSTSLVNCPTNPGQVLGSNTTRPTGGIGGAGQVQGTTTSVLPATLPATGPEDSSINFLYGILASIAAYGATYFLQGKRRVEQV